MKYQARLPEHNDNVTPGHPLKDFALILGALSAAVLAGYLVLGWLVDVVVERMAPQTEARLTQLVAWTPPPSEPAMRSRQAWAQALVDAMRDCAGVSAPVTLHVSRSDTPNAMVAPGGLMIVFSSLFDSVQSENGMAFVLAHELAHMAQRDHVRALGRRLVLIAAATVLTGDGGAAASVLVPAQQVGESGYSRKREEAADMKALAILECRYGHAGGATEFFDTLQRKQDRWPAFVHYLASHPALAARGAALRAAMRQDGVREGPVRPLPRF